MRCKIFRATGYLLVGDFRMEDSPVTRASLLLRIRDGQDKEAWRQFVEIYAPLIYGFARKRGLQDADAADLMQDVLRSIASAVGRLDYDPRRGSFRRQVRAIVSRSRGRPGTSVLGGAGSRVRTRSSVSITDAA